jgi:pimeloyl-ACP methyl ester carboxylesterase
LRLSQQILLSPLGSWFSKLPIETFFKKQIRTLFANQSAISDEELDQWFNLMGYNHGLQNMHRLIEYIRDRHRFEPRWTRALQATSVPIRLIWGALDAVAPLVIAQEVAQLVPKATLTTIAAGHWPFVEKPDEFIDAFLNK